jgi:hypothetical protein
VHEAPQGTIEVRSIFGSLVATGTLAVRNVLPGIVREIGTSVGEGFWLGRYSVLLRPRYGAGGEELVAKTIVWVVPWRTQGWKVLLALGFALWVILARKRFRRAWYVLKTEPSAAGQPLNNIHMLTYILMAIAVAVFVYAKRHGFRRAWYILRTAAENPDWEELGDYFIASWEKRSPARWSAVNEEAQATSSK